MVASRPSNVRNDQVDDFDSDERRDDAAQSVHKKVHRSSASAPAGDSHPRSASGTSVMMMSALKITADKIADWAS